VVYPASFTRPVLTGTLPWVNFQVGKELHTHGVSSAYPMLV
jgi:hypothetical protein